MDRGIRQCSWVQGTDNLVRTTLYATDVVYLDTGVVLLNAKPDRTTFITLLLKCSRRSRAARVESQETVGQKEFATPGQPGTATASMATTASSNTRVPRGAEEEAAKAVEVVAVEAEADRLDVEKVTVAKEEKENRKGAKESHLRFVSSRPWSSRISPASWKRRGNVTEILMRNLLPVGQGDVLPDMMRTNSTTFCVGILQALWSSRPRRTLGTKSITRV